MPAELLLKWWSEANGAKTPEYISGYAVLQICALVGNILAIWYGFRMLNLFFGSDFDLLGTCYYPSLSNLLSSFITNYFKQ